MVREPAIAIIIPVWNAAGSLGTCLLSIRNQDYPQEHIRILCAEGGSTDATREIVRAFGAEILVCPDREQEANRVRGVRATESDLILFVDADNQLPHHGWLRKMVAPFLADPEVCAAQPWRYHYDPADRWLNRYFALIGGNDPVAAYGLGKRDRLNHAEERWTLVGKSRDQGAYVEVEFSPDEVPTLGANGFLVRRNVLMKADLTPETAHHMDLCYDMICQGYTRFAMVKETIIHRTARSLPEFLRKKWHFAGRHHFRQVPRRCPVYDGRADRAKLARFLLETMAVVPALRFSWQGWRKLPDGAWWFHWVACGLFIGVYGWTVVRKMTNDK